MLRNLNRSSGGIRICGTPFVGVLKTEIPVEGDFPALLLDDIAAGDPAGTRYRLEVLSWPHTGELRVKETGEFMYTPPTSEFIGMVSGLQRIYKNDIAVYGAKYQILVGMTLVSAELASFYDVSGTIVFTPVSRQIVPSYMVRHWVSRNFVANTGVLNKVSASISGGYTVRHRVVKSITGSFVVLSEIVPTSVTTELTSNYNVHCYVQRELKPAYPVKALVMRNIHVSFEISVNGESMSFIPSQQRTLYALAGRLPFKAGSSWDMTDPYKPSTRHDPQAILEYTIDWEPWGLDIEADIGTHSIEVKGGLINQGSSVEGYKVTFWIAVTPDFDPLAAHEVTCRIRSNSMPERQDDRTIALILVNK